MKRNISIEVEKVNVKTSVVNSEYFGQIIDSKNAEIENMKNCLNCDYYNGVHGEYEGDVRVKCKEDEDYIVLSYEEKEIPACSKWRMKNDKQK